MIFGSLGLLVAAGGLLAAGITGSDTGLLVASFACTVVAGALLLIAYATARGGAVAGGQGVAPLGAAPMAIPGTQPVLMYVPVGQVPGALQPVGAPTGGNGGTSFGAPDRAFAPTAPFLGYDEMTAEQVVKLVSSGALTTEQLEALHEYELEGQARKTVLDKLDRALR
jgi:hypothetical protein